MFGSDLVKIQRILQKGISPNIQDKFGKTPLLKSIEAGNLNFASEFMRFNADPFLADYSGLTAFAAAPPDFRLEISRFLKSRNNAVKKVERKPKEPDTREPALMWTGVGWKPKDRKFDHFVQVNKHRSYRSTGTTLYPNNLCPRGA